MDTILGFFSNLILFTAGLIVVGLYIILIVVISVESYDFFIGDHKKSDVEEEIELPDIY